MLSIQLKARLQNISLLMRIENVVYKIIHVKTNKWPPMSIKPYKQKETVGIVGHYGNWTTASRSIL